MSDVTLFRLRLFFFPPFPLLLSSLLLSPFSFCLLISPLHLFPSVCPPLSFPSSLLSLLLLSTPLLFSSLSCSFLSLSISLSSLSHSLHLSPYSSLPLTCARFDLCGSLTIQLLTQLPVWLNAAISRLIFGARPKKERR